MLGETLAALGSIPRDAVWLRYVDNGSRDESVSMVREILPDADIIELRRNAGFSAAHNIGLAKCETPLVLTCDPDVTLNWPGIKRLLSAFNDKNAGAAQGKLYRAARSDNGRPIIDSAGIVHTLALNGRERGANEPDTGQYEEKAQVLAVTGACGLYRLEALRSVMQDGCIFDEDFFSYKEDVDLGWRLNKAGWKVVYLPVTAGTHRRTMGRRGVMGWGLKAATVRRRLKSQRTRLSLRNWMWMIAKNASLKQELKHEIFIDLRLLVFLVFSVLYPPLLSVWVEAGRGLPRMLNKRL